MNASVFKRSQNLCICLHFVPFFSSCDFIRTTEVTHRGIKKEEAIIIFCTGKKKKESMYMLFMYG
jgi:hypothetical protein